MQALEIKPALPEAGEECSIRVLGNAGGPLSCFRNSIGARVGAIGTISRL